MLTAAWIAGMAVGLAACGGSTSDRPPAAPIAVDGSSTVFPVTEAVAEEFQKAHPDRRVTVGESGTGGGFQKFCAGETALSDASRPIKPSEIDRCRKAGVEFIELPVAYDGLAVVVNPKNTWAASMTVAELKRLWEPAAEGKVTRWSQIRSGWPDRPIDLYGPGVDSGTFDYFTEAIVGKEGASRGDYTSSEDDNVLVQGVAGSEYGLGYFGYAYYEQNRDRLKLVAIDDQNDDNGQGPIVPSPETVRGGTYRPLSRPLFLYVSRRALERAEVREFVEFYLTRGPVLVREVGYVPLSERELALTRERFKAGTTGTIFAGEPAGASLEALLSKRP